jgi:hypothetical protein
VDVSNALHATQAKEGNMITKEEEAGTKSAEEGTGLTEERVAAMVNQAISSHAKRQSSAIEKLLEEKLGKFAEAIKPAPATEGEKSTKGSTEAQMVKQQMDELRRLYDEEKAARVATDTKSKWDSAQNQLRLALQKKQIRPELLEVAVGHLAHVSKALRFDENGNPILGVKRSRMKGAAAEENIFDIDGGVEDWLKTEEAKPFMPPPPSLNMLKQNGQAGNRTALPKYEQGPVSDEDRARRMAEMLSAAGVELER